MTCVSSRMGCLVLLILLVLVFGAGTVMAVGLTIGLLGLLLTLIVAGLVGWAADLIVPGELPFGWVGAVLTGLIGGFVGHLVFRFFHIPGLGLSLFGIDLIPAFVGAVIIAVAAQLFTTQRRVV
jgi:uncharacterized membrane protein YeaQ/YmgE (transglycosylase-associated protein family)